MQPFEIKQPKTLKEATDALPKERSFNAPQIIAGGQDILTVMKNDIEAPSTLIEIGGLGLDKIDIFTAGTAGIGATATIQAIADHVQLGERYPAIREAARSIGSPQIRSQATIGGNLNQRPRCPYYRHSAVSCYKKGGSVCLAEFGFNKYAAIFGDGPSYFSHPSDMAPALMVCDATVTIEGPTGFRSVSLDNYFVSPEESVETETVLKPNEVLTHVTLPMPPNGTKTTYYKFKERESYDFALAAVAISIRMQGDTITDPKVVLGGVAPMPWRSKEAEEALAGKKMEPATWKAAGEAAVANAVPLEMNGYKVHLVKGIMQRALEGLAS